MGHEVAFKARWTEHHERQLGFTRPKDDPKLDVLEAVGKVYQRQMERLFAFPDVDVPVKGRPVRHRVHSQAAKSLPRRRQRRRWLGGPAKRFE
eukprot:1011209-Amorphochlora_amoeboformis.AAC.1